MIQTVRHGMPFLGYMSSRPRHMIPGSYITDDSFNYLLSPADGAFVSRAGSILYGTQMAEDWSLLNATQQWVKLLAFSSASTSLSPPHLQVGGLWGGNLGTVFTFMSDAGGAIVKHQIGQEFGGTHYPANFKMPPLLASGIYSRMATAIQRARIADGSRSVLDVNDQLLFPSYNGIPWRWNKQYNEASGSGTYNCRIYPIGHIPPLWPPTLAVAGGDIDPNGAIIGGNWYYCSVVFERADGSRSMPFIPRGPSATFPTGYGLTQLGVAGNNYRLATVSTIPIGPDGTVRRHVLLTAPQPSAFDAAIEDLQVWFTLDNNSETSYIARDLALTTDDLIVRFDHSWMPPSRYAWAGDQRTWCGYSAPNTASVVITPYQNNNDETPGATIYTVDLQGSPYLLTLTDSANGAPKTTQINLTTVGTVEALVDAINNTADSGVNGGKWKAQLVPGADGTLPANQLITTTGVDLGDGANLMRCYSNAVPGILYMGANAIPQKEQKRRIYFTIGGPGSPAISSDAWSVENYRTAPATAGELLGGGNTLNGQVLVFSKSIGVCRNIRDVRSGVDKDYYLVITNETRGGIAPATIVQGNGWVGYMTRDGFVVNDGLRETIISGAVYDPATRTGDLANVIARCEYSTLQDDPNMFKSANLTASVVGSRLFICYDDYQSTAKSSGILIYDFSAGVNAGGIDGVLNGSEAWGWSSPIYLTGDHDYLRTNTGPVVGTSIGSIPTLMMGTTLLTGFPDLRILKILSGSIDSSNYIYVLADTQIGPNANVLIVPSGGTWLQEYLIPGVTKIDQNANIPPGAIVTAVGFDAGASQWLVTMNVNALFAGETYTAFTGLGIHARLYCPTDSIQTTKRKSIQRVTTYYKNADAGLNLTISRDKNRASQRVMPLAASGAGDLFTRKVKNMPLPLRTGAEVIEVGYSDLGSGSYASSIWGNETEVDILESNK